MHVPETYRARQLRNNMTDTERRLWSRLRNGQVDGYKLRRQVPVGPYFVDFLCISARLAIEVDGPFHEDESDRRKTARLEAEGYRVLRIPVTDIDQTLGDVVHGICLKLTEQSLPTRVSPPGSAFGTADLPAQRGGQPHPLLQEF